MGIVISLDVPFTLLLSMCMAFGHMTLSSTESDIAQHYLGGDW